MTTTIQIGSATITVAGDGLLTPEVHLVPQSVTMRQARLALNAAGLLGAVEAAVQAADKATQIEWEYAQTVERDWPTLALLAGALGLTDESLDALFSTAAQL